MNSGSRGAILKLDYEKAFDRVNLDFLDELLALRGFGPKISHWIHLATRGGSVAVKFNGVEGIFSQLVGGSGRGTLCLLSFSTVWWTCSPAC
jgi:hypothetical protein